MLTRKPVCAGTWYPETRDLIEGYIDKKVKPKDRVTAVACVCPHAGWLYSGKVAGSVYSTIDVARYDTFVLIGPNHTGHGAGAGIFPEGEWQMPLGKVPVDDEMVKAIIQFSEFIEPDTRCHANEHCLEVQIPFIQYFRPDAKIVPIIMMHDSFDVCADIANAITSAVKQFKDKKRVLIVASSDMTHYESRALAEEKDKMAINEILKLDAQCLIKTVVTNGITMCGVFPVATVIMAAEHLGAEEASLVSYATSGGVTGDYSSVVGYAGLIIR
jgi:hypothetical protein